MISPDGARKPERSVRADCRLGRAGRRLIPGEALDPALVEHRQRFGVAQPLPGW